MQKTAYDMRISDWSSDVCSSDLGMTVEDNLRMGAFPRAARAKFGQQLEFVYELFPRMRERRKQLAGTMSGGEQQMCAIGRALMSSPKLQLMDETSAALAPVIVQQVVDLVLPIRQEGVYQPIHTKKDRQ